MITWLSKGFYRFSESLFKFHIFNHGLLKIQQEKLKIKEINNFKIMATTDRRATTQCFLILPNIIIPITDISILQAIIDQVQFFINIYLTTMK